MIRQMLRLAIEAAKVEIDHWKNPGQEPALVEPEPVSAPPLPSAPDAVVDRDVKPAKDARWSSAAFHMETLKSTTCPDCGETKKVGDYRCRECTAIVVARRDEAERNAPWNMVQEVDSGKGGGHGGRPRKRGRDARGGQEEGPKGTRSSARGASGDRDVSRGDPNRAGDGSEAPKATGVAVR